MYLSFEVWCISSVKGQSLACRDIQMPQFALRKEQFFQVCDGTRSQFHVLPDFLFTSSSHLNSYTFNLKEARSIQDYLVLSTPSSDMSFIFLHKFKVILFCDLEIG